MSKLTNLTNFWKPGTCGQTVLPDILLFQKVESDKLQNFKWHILRYFQTLCICANLRFPFTRNSSIRILNKECNITVGIFGSLINLDIYQTFCWFGKSFHRRRTFLQVAQSPMHAITSLFLLSRASFNVKK